MKNHRIVKSLTIVAVSALSLLSGASQAEGRGHFERAYSPNPYLQSGVEHPGFRGRTSDNWTQAAFDIDARQQDQMRRIMQGVRSGALSQHEAKKLLREQKNIEHLQRRYLSDRRLNRNEWIELDRLLNRAERNIRYAMHNRYRR